MYENYSVLFVDDEEKILQSIRRGLLDENFKAFFAMSGAEALAIMEQQRIDVIITDMRMPEMNGLELLSTISEKWPKTVKIVLTGFTQLPQILATINKVDIFKFLTKPWHLEELISVIHKALDIYMLKEENDHYKQTLETQNRTFKNILKKSDDTIAYARRSNELLGLCGKSIMEFGKGFTLAQKEKYRRVFDLQGDLFALISRSISAEEAVFSADELNKYLAKQLQPKYPKMKLQTSPAQSGRFKLNAGLLSDILLTVLLLFAEECVSCGMELYTGVFEKGAYSATIRIPGAYTESTGDEKEPGLIDIKLRFLLSFTTGMLEACRMPIKAKKSGGNIMIHIQINSEVE